MDIVDAQVHVAPGQLQATLGAMDALGVQAALIDEAWGGHAPGDPGNVVPGYPLPNGAWRTASPIAELAALQHPDRFSYLVRVDRRDPDLESVLKLVKSTPHRRALRVLPVRTDAEAEAFAAGAYDELFALAQSLGLPVFLFVPGQVGLLPRHLRAFPRLSFIIDHCGAPFPGLGPKSAGDRPDGAAYFQEVLNLAAYGNVALKWSHAPMRLLPCDAPYEALRPHLRRALDAFGPRRVMWASDHTVMPGHSWADLLLFIRDNPDLSAEEKGWVLGGSARKILDCPPLSQG